MRPLLLCLAPIVVTGSCASADEGTAPRLVRLDVLEGNRCTVSVDGKSFALTDEVAIEAAFPPNKTPKADVNIMGGSAIPYRCIGGLIYTVQRRGYGKVAFISEPPVPDGSN